MQRDPDLMRQLLVEAENEAFLALLFTYHGLSTAEELSRMHHARLLVDAGMFAQTGKTFFRITNKGHDFLVATRDPSIWEAAKEAALVSEAETPDIVFEIANALLREKVRDVTGFEI